MMLTLMRHGEVEQKYKGRYNGHIDISLSNEGLQEVKTLAPKLEAMKFDKVYTSDLKRAKETLSALELNTATIFTPLLREKSWGIHEGKSFEEIEAMGIKYENFEQWINALDGENALRYKENIKEYFYETIAKDEAKNILVVTHAGVIKTLLHIVQNISLQDAFSIKLEYANIITIEI